MDGADAVREIAEDESDNECFNLVVGFLTLGVLSWTLYVLKKYARDTNILARTSVEQLPLPCVVLKQSADSSVEAVFGGTACSLDTEPGYNSLNFVNVGTDVPPELSSTRV